MSHALLAGLLTGAVFGTALYKVTAIRYERVVGMLLLTDVKIMKFAFSTISVAAFAYGLADIFGLSEATGIAPRVMAFTGWAHVAGGVLFGASMAATGFCPGTAACRAGVNLGSTRFEALFAVVGLFLGVYVYALLKLPLQGAGVIDAPQGLTLHGWMGMPYGPAAMLLGALFLTLTALVDRYLPEVPSEPVTAPRGVLDRVRGEWHFFPAGALAGLTIVAASMQDGYIGYSGSILAVYGWVADAIGQTSSLVPKVTDAIVWRAALIVGVVLGAAFARLWSLPTQQEASPAARPAAFDAARSARVMLGAGGLSLGAMVGGGCTTGAFLSAFPTLSVGSFAMGTTFFASAMGTAWLMRRVGAVRLVGGRVQLPAVGRS